MLYVDTSVIVKLYFKEEYSLSVSNWLKENNEAIPFTTFHELEFNNAVNLKEFRAEITADEIRLIMARFAEHEGKGVFYRPQISWNDTFRYAVDLSNKHTNKTGSRALDILHVASALSIRADRFLTFDERQSTLAALSGMRIAKVI
ncbi:MAG: type II toxin-antitoxin system VapC family toxin [Thermodesulfobacteriota bacterium]|nr:type II toxin-antitoxin system VapC family toxin [Thermodesulfobacteriota bacterium]